MGCLIAPDARRYTEATIYFLRWKEEKNGSPSSSCSLRETTESVSRSQGGEEDAAKYTRPAGFYAISCDFEEQLAATLALLHRRREGEDRERSSAELVDPPSSSHRTGDDDDDLFSPRRRLPRCSFYAHVKDWNRLLLNRRGETPQSPDSSRDYHQQLAAEDRRKSDRYEDDPYVHLVVEPYIQRDSSGGGEEGITPKAPPCGIPGL